MPSKHLALLLLLAACEHAESTTGKPVFPEQPEPVTKAPEPEPVAEAPAPEPEPAPAVAPVKPEPVKIVTPKAPSLSDYDRRCMSRAGCRWENQPKEEQPRVWRKKAGDQ